LEKTKNEDSVFRVFEVGWQDFGCRIGLGLLRVLEKWLKRILGTGFALSFALSLSLSLSLSSLAIESKNMKRYKVTKLIMTRASELIKIRGLGENKHRQREKEERRLRGAR